MRTLRRAAAALALVLASAGAGQAQLAQTGAGNNPTFTASCTQSSNFIARTSGFSVAQKYQYDAAICALVTSGTFAKLAALYVFDAPSQTAALLNIIKNSYNATLTGTVYFGAGAGFTSDGSTGYIVTNFVPSTASDQYALGSNSMGAVISNPRHVFQNNNVLLGGYDTTFTTFDFLENWGETKVATNVNYYATGPGTNWAQDTTITEGDGFWAGTTIGGAVNPTFRLYRNATLLGTTTISATLTKIPDQSIWILTDGFGDFSSDTVTGAYIGGPLTATDITNLNAFFAAFPPNGGFPPAMARGFTSNVFSYNFATRGLNGIDVNSTDNPGYQFYTSWWYGNWTFFGTRGPAANCYAAQTGYVIMGCSTLARLSTAGDTTSEFVATISDTTMTVSSVLQPTIAPLLVGQTVAGNAVLSGQKIVSCQSPQTTPFTCQLSGSATIASPANLIGQSYVGTTFAPGGYYESSMAWGTGGTGFPNFWLITIGGLLSAGSSGYGAALEFIEIDIVPNGTPNTQWSDWTCVNGNCGTLPSYTNYNASILNWPAAVTASSPNFHLYGMLWIPSTQNAGTGKVQYYLDRTLQPSMTLTYTAAGTPSIACSPSNPAGCLFIAETGRTSLMFDSGAAPTYTAIQNVNVWH